MKTHRSISSRSRAIRLGNLDGLSWADQSIGEVFSELCEEADLYGRPLSEEKYAQVLAQHDSAFLDSPGSAAGVPQRWWSVYDAALERAYRKAIRAKVTELDAD